MSLKQSVRKIEKIRDRVLRLANPTMKRWVTAGDDPCPICNYLESLGWIPIGKTEIDYKYEKDGSTVTELKRFPDFREAHSTIGGPNWNASDDSCECQIIYR